MEFFIILAICLVNPLLMILHELGHAFAYLALTKPEKIDVFIGSYGNKKTKLKFKIRKLHFYIKPTFPYIINGGMCRSSIQESNYINKIVILLAGPFFPFFFSVVIGIYAFNTEIHDSMKLYCSALILLSFISLVTNLIPKTIKKAGIDNDGKQLAFIMRIRGAYSEYLLANEVYAKGDYAFASERFRHLVSLFPYEEKFSRPLVNSLLMTKNFSDAERYLTELKKYGNYKTQDFLMWGCLQSYTNRHDEAIANYKKVLAYDPINLVGLNNLGYELILKEDFTDAEEVLKKAIKFNPNFSHPYSGLGYLKILTGLLEEGKQLVDKSIELDAYNAFGYKHLGVYYLKLYDKEKALFNFNKAIELDSTMDIGNYLKEAGLL